MGKPKASKEAIRLEQEAVIEHKVQVARTMKTMANKLDDRGLLHDVSKLGDEELPYFAAATSMKELTYGTTEYQKALDGLGPALAHHYGNNRHHPEHHQDGIRGMNLVDITEMLCDWHAAGKRHGNGHNIFKSINHNRMRFMIKRDLAQILWNTAIDIFGEEPEEGYKMVVLRECADCGRWQGPPDVWCRECSSHRTYTV